VRPLTLQPCENKKSDTARQGGQHGSGHTRARYSSGPRQASRCQRQGGGPPNARSSAGSVNGRFWQTAENGGCVVTSSCRTRGAFLCTAAAAGDAVCTKATASWGTKLSAAAVRAVAAAAGGNRAATGSLWLGAERSAPTVSHQRRGANLTGLGSWRRRRASGSGRAPLAHFVQQLKRHISSAGQMCGQIDARRMCPAPRPVRGR